MTTEFNVVVVRDQVHNVKQLLLHLFSCVQNKEKICLFIDESPDLAYVNMGKTTLIGFLESFCDKFNVDRTDIHIIIENLVQSSCWPSLEKTYRSVDVFHAKNLSFIPQKQIKYKTSMFVAGSRWPRLVMASHLHKFYKQDSLMTYWQNVKDPTQPCNLHIDDALFNMNPATDQLIDQIGAFVRQLPIHLREQDRKDNKNVSVFNHVEAYTLLPEYNSVFCDVICETVHDGQTFAFTEKIARCWVSKTPYLAFAPKDYLKNLARLGFKSFDPFWDESYDNFSNKNRIVQMQRNIKKIHALPYDQLQKMYESTQMQEILDHNHEIFAKLDTNQIMKEFA